MIILVLAIVIPFVLVVVVLFLNGIRLLRKADRALEECNATDWKILGLAKPAVWVRWINAGACTPWFADMVLWVLRRTLVQPALKKSLRLMKQAEDGMDEKNTVVKKLLCDSAAREAMQQRLDEYYSDIKKSKSLTQFGKIVNYAGAYMCLTNHHVLLTLGLQVSGDDEVVRAPVIITSFPRTGTTILHRTMSKDRDRFRTFDLCDMVVPAPRPIPRWDTEGRLQKAKEASALVDSLESIYPGWKDCMETMHGFRLGEADEDLGWYDSGLGHMYMDPLMKLARESRLRPEGRHPIESKEVAKYRYAWLAMVMKIYQHADRTEWSKLQAKLSTTEKGGGEPCPTENLPWILKDPNHSAYLNQLLAEFPDAKLIFTHRAPGDIVASLAKLFMVFVSPEFIPGAPGTTSREWGLEAKKRMEHYSSGLVEFTKEQGKDSMFGFQRDGLGSDRRIDFFFRDVVQDIPGTIATIYSQFYRTLPGPTPKALQLFEEYLSENEREKKGNQPRSLSDFGLTPHDVAFHEYCDLFLGDD